MRRYSGSFFPKLRQRATQGPAEGVVPVLIPIKLFSRTLLVFLYKTYLVLLPFMIVDKCCFVLTIFLNFSDFMACAHRTAKSFTVE